jgi:hypothetical protein
MLHQAFCASLLLVPTSLVFLILGSLWIDGNVRISRAVVSNIKDRSFKASLDTGCMHEVACGGSLIFMVNNTNTYCSPSFIDSESMICMSRLNPCGWSHECSTAFLCAGIIFVALGSLGLLFIIGLFVASCMAKHNTSVLPFDSV